MEIQNSNGDRWKEIRIGELIPPNAVLAGQDGENHPLYVARVWHETNLLPGVITGTSTNTPTVLWITALWGEFQNFKFQGDILVGIGYFWKASEEMVPEDTVVAGEMATGEPLYASRLQSTDDIHIGWASEGYNFRGYEVLVKQNSKPPVASLTESDTSHTSGQCCVCLEKEAIMAVLPCGHLCLCRKCSQNRLLVRCPVCRGSKQQCVRIFKNLRCT
jgi:Zinc finger, C3HC4 type (RING finger)/Protein of unknown function (DUF3421)